MTLTNPAPVLYQNMINNLKGRKTSKKTPSTGMMGFSELGNLKSNKADKELSPAERSANYFEIIKNKREELKNGDETKRT